MTSEPAAAHFREIPRYVGPVSVLGVVVGVLMWTLPMHWGGNTYLLYLVPPAGLLLLVVPGAARQFGAGLVGALLFWPVAALGLLLLVLGLAVVGAEGPWV
ncbi:hypothetical protein [Nocardioides alcanivorans]|uniref:hypothetical protein n=1 Tax=Nocardioides alcanivorans TaxID=2897352 RepID=UPI001F329616|nr:hypothetical protein [Nocardioides alcanivorans]